MDDESRRRIAANAQLDQVRMRTRDEFLSDPRKWRYALRQRPELTREIMTADQLDLDYDEAANTVTFGDDDFAPDGRYAGLDDMSAT